MRRTNIIYKWTIAHNELDYFTIQPTTQNEVSKILQNMRSDSSTVHDNIPIKFLKFAANDIFFTFSKYNIEAIICIYKDKEDDDI